MLMGGRIVSKYKGTYIGYINDNKIILKDVLYIPSFKRNLLSIYSLCKDNYKIMFYNYENKNKVKIYNKKGNRIYTSTAIESTKTYKIYFLKEKLNVNSLPTSFSIEETDDDKILKLWHRRMGHFNIAIIKDRLPNINLKEKFMICVESKIKNFLYYLSKNKTTEPFEMVHMDTVLNSDKSIYGNKYFFTIMDDYTRFGWTFFLKSKAEVFPTFLKWYNKVKNIFNKNIKYLKTDNGTEYSNSLFDNFCDQNGIVHLYSIPYNPQQNGKSERFQQTLIHCARALLNDSKLHYSFWEDALSTANYIHNRLPHKGIDNKIPYEVLFNKKVDFNKFKVFGCQVFFYVPKHLRKKFENSSSPGIFIGYDRNPTAYRIYDTQHNKIILSGAVEFFEDMPVKSICPSSPPDIIDFSLYYENGGSDSNTDKNTKVSFQNNENDNNSIDENNNVNFNSNNSDRNKTNSNTNTTNTDNNMQTKSTLVVPSNDNNLNNLSHTNQLNNVYQNYNIYDPNKFFNNYYHESQKPFNLNNLYSYYNPFNYYNNFNFPLNYYNPNGYNPHIWQNPNLQNLQDFQNYNNTIQNGNYNLIQNKINSSQNENNLNNLNSNLVQNNNLNNKLNNLNFNSSNLNPSENLSIHDPNVRNEHVSNHDNKNNSSFNINNNGIEINNKLLFNSDQNSMISENKQNQNENQNSQNFEEMLTMYTTINDENNIDSSSNSNQNTEQENINENVISNFDNQNENKENSSEKDKQMMIEEEIDYDKMEEEENNENDKIENERNVENSKIENKGNIDYDEI